MPFAVNGSIGVVDNGLFRCDDRLTELLVIVSHSLSHYDRAYKSSCLAVGLSADSRPLTQFTIAELESVFSFLNSQEVLLTRRSGGLRWKREWRNEYEVFSIHLNRTEEFLDSADVVAVDEQLRSEF